LWFTKWNWKRLFSEYFGISPFVSFHQSSELVHSTTTKTKKCHKKGYTERRHKEMATSMGGNNERGDY
jgi:hypothetical protein